MNIPDWDDLAPWTRAVIEEGMAVGDSPGAAVALFEDGQATVLGRPTTRLGDVGSAVFELVAMLGMLGASGMAVVQPIRLREPGDAGPLRDARAETAALVTRAAIDDGIVTTSAALHHFTSDDCGVPVWGTSEELDVSPIGEVLAAALRAGSAHGETGAGITYAADRFGHGIAVAPAWRDRYGLDGPLDPSMVRREDRRRVKHRMAVAS